MLWMPETPVSLMFPFNYSLRLEVGAGKIIWEPCAGAEESVQMEKSQ